MGLVGLADILAGAREERYAVPAFQAFNYEMLEGILQAAETERSPVIVQVWAGMDRATRLGRFVAAARAMMEESPVPATLHLDHGRNLEEIERALEVGLNSVMIDASLMEFDRNVETTSKVVSLAREHGVSVEAELGHVGSGGRHQQETLDGLTSPEDAGRFVRLTGIHALAVAVGTAHGNYTAFAPRIDLDRLARIREEVSVPLVLHGGSGVPDDQIRRALDHGVCKINVATELVEAFNEGLGLIAEGEREVSIIEALVPAVDAVKAKAVEKIRLFCSDNRA